MTSFLKVTSRLLFNQQVRTAFRLYGVYPTVVTPFTTSRYEAPSIDFARFDRMLIHLKRFPVAGFALLGSTSNEFAAISTDKKVDLVRHARRHLGKTPVILTGAGSESTNDTIDLVSKMADAGSDACLVYNPEFFRECADLSQYLDHFLMVADRSPVPIIIYNVPPSMETDIPLEVVVYLAKHPNIMGLLDMGGDISRMTTICMRTSSNRKPFDVMTGSAAAFLPALLAGCRGTICSLANILPFELSNLQELVEEGRYDKAQKLQWRLLDPNDAITSRFGVAGLKAILRDHVGIDTGSIKSPQRDLTDDEMMACVKMFTDNGFLMSSKIHLERP